jgi:predicted NAD/FAD-dependent oxidoreductase
MTTIAIIGAGLSGLTAATLLQNNATVTVFEKSRGVSGRMSTRRAEPFQFDHGAQFFTAKTDAFNDFIRPMMEQGVIQRWDARLVEFDNRQLSASYHWGEHCPHYVGSPSMSAVAKYLSRTLTVNLGVRVASVTREQAQWHLMDDQGNSLGRYDWLISAAPVQQAVDLLPESFAFYPQMKSVEMKACFSLMLGFEHPLAVDFDAAFVKGEDISWISVNSSKPNRNEAFCLLVNSTNQWAEEHIDDDRDDVVHYLCEQVSAIIGHDVTRASHKAIQGWRYANIEEQANEPYYIDANQQLAVCGDWCIEGRVEAAFISGFQLANQLLQKIK